MADSSAVAEHSVLDSEHHEGQAAGLAASPEPAQPPGALVAEELLVEEVSIDGMCGVY